MSYDYMFLSEGADLAVELKRRTGNKLSLNGLTVLTAMTTIVEAKADITIDYIHIAEDWFNREYNLDVVRGKIREHLDLNEKYQLKISNCRIQEEVLKKLGCDVKSGLNELKRLKLIERTTNDEIVLLFTNFHKSVLASVEKYCEKLKDKDEYNALIDRIEEITGLKKSRTQLKHLLREKFFGKPNSQELLIQLLLENNYTNITDGTRLDYIKNARSKISINGKLYT